MNPDVVSEIQEPFIHDPSFLLSDVEDSHADWASTESPPKPVRVLHIINGEHYAGAERVQDLLAQRLPEHGFQVGFACLKPDQFPVLRKSQDVPLVEVPMGSRLDLRVATRLRDIVKREGYQLVHAHTPRSCMIARVVAAMARVPLVYHVHSPTSHDSDRRWSNCINAWIERLSLTGVSQMIAVSESLARHMCGIGYNPNLIAIVPNGVPCRPSIPARRPPIQCWTLGAVALFRPRKGIEVLLDALSILRGFGFDVRLRAVGTFESTEYETAIKDQVARLGLEEYVHWTGFTHEVEAEFDQMDLLVLPSLFGEGLPMVILEAMAAGVPVAATRLQGVHEVIRDGQDGILTAPGCKTDLARAIRQVIRGEVCWTKLRENAFARQRELFSDLSMAAGTAAAYRRVFSTANV